MYIINVSKLLITASHWVTGDLKRICLLRLSLSKARLGSEVVVAVNANWLWSTQTKIVLPGNFAEYTYRKMPTYTLETCDVVFH